MKPLKEVTKAALKGRWNMPPTRHGKQQSRITKTNITYDQSSRPFRKLNRNKIALHKPQNEQTNFYFTKPDMRPVFNETK